MIKWISVKDKLPETHERVVVKFFDNTDPVVSFVTDTNFFTARGKTITYPIWVDTRKEVTHWAPLPN